MTPDRHLRLCEYGAPVELRLTPPERDALLGAPAALDVRPVIGSPDLWRVGATHVVGLFRAGELTVEIEPKVGVARVLELLAHGLGLPALGDPEVRAATHEGLLEAMAWIYLATLRRALGRGLPHGYRSVDEDLVAVRGRIQFEQHLRRRPHTWHPIAVRHDEFSPDIPLNRVFKAALRALVDLPCRHERTRAELRRWLRVLHDVADVPRGDPSLRGVVPDRPHAHAAPALALAHQILATESIDTTGGRTATPGLFLDLASLFERFVRATLRRTLGLPEAHFPAAGGRALHLDREATIALRPDLLWRDSGRIHFVGDVKYKRPGDDGRARAADIYQLLAYATRCRTRHALLIHAAAQPRRVHRVVTSDQGEIELEIVGLDLSRSLDEAVNALGRLAQQIRTRRLGAVAL